MWPTENDYTKAVTRINPSPFSLLNSKKIKIITDENDQPVKKVGNNSVIFKVYMDEKFYALKCYTKEINNQAYYLSAVQKYVEQLNAPWLIPFELYESGIYVIKSENSFHGTYCVLLMPWIDGETLYDFVQKSCEEKNTKAIEEIFKQFQQTAVWLLQQPFVHGDLAAENIIVTPEGKLILADYDNILFDELKFSSGHSPFNADYQHPKRNANIINLAADHFSILILAISLRALQFKPELFFANTNESGLLFTANSLREGDKSILYKELKNIDDIYLQNLLRLFNISIHKQNIEVPMLATCIADFDPESYSRLLEIEVEDLKKDLENSLLQVQILQTEVSKELLMKEKLFVENKRLRETIAEIETKKRKLAALKKSISLSLAGLTCVAVLAGILFFTTHTKQTGAFAVNKNKQVKTMPVSANAPIKKDPRKIIIVPQIETASVSKKIIQKENTEAMDIKKNTITNNKITAENTIMQKNDATVASLKPRKTKKEKSGDGYNMFRAGGF